MKAANEFEGISQYFALPVGAKAWLSAAGWAVVIGIAYFLASRLGLSLLVAPSYVAMFWPASGIGAGILIAFGRRAFPALAIGVMIGTVAANMLSDRSLATSVFKGFCYIGEPVILAWLVERWFGPAFSLRDLRRVLGFLTAAAIAAATSAIGGAATITLLHTTAPFWDVWRVWLLSDGVGIAVVAPLIIELRRALGEPPSRRETIQGAAVLTVLGSVAIYVYVEPTQSWISFEPEAFIFPPLLWLAARWPPPFAIAGAFIVSAVAMATTIFSTGHLSDVLPITERVHGVQATVVMITVFTLVLVALFAQRRESKAQLAKKSAALAHLHEVSSRLWLKRDLPRALDEILVGAIKLLGADMGIIRILDPTRGVLNIEAHWGFKQEFIDSFREVSAIIDSPCGRTLRSGERIVIADVEEDELFTPFRPRARSAGVRAVLSTPIMSREHAPLGTLTTHFRPVCKPAEHDLHLLDLYVRQAADIIERHKAEDALRESEERLRERNAQLALAGRAALVGSYTYDVNKGAMLVSEGYAAIHGLPEGTTETSYSEWQARVHPDDLGSAEAVRDQAFADRRKEDNAEYRIVLSTGEVRWIERRGSISYGEDGRPERVVGVDIDITTRKQAEAHQSTLLAELDHRVKNVLATVSAIIVQTPKANSSLADYVAGLGERIKSLARTHELLSHSRWHGVSLEEIVQRELAPYLADNAEIGGPHVTLKAEAAPVLGMVLHELATNAAKHGAFSKPGGRLLLRWRWLGNGSPGRLIIDWQEFGGLPNQEPSEPGYGTSIIRELIPFELGGTADLNFASSGLRCRLEIPADWASGADHEDFRALGSAPTSRA